MAQREPDLVPVLTAAGFEALASDPAGADLAAVVDARRFAVELAAAPDAACVRELPFQGAYCYRWIAVELGSAPPDARASFLAGVREAGAVRPGLLLTTIGPAEPGTGVEVVAADGALGPGRDDPWYFLQYCRFLLRALGRTRIAFASPYDAALFADALAGHEVAVSWSFAELAEVLEARESGAATSGGPKEHYMALLSWLRTDFAEPPGRAFVGSGAAGDAALAAALAAARAMHVPDGCRDRAALRGLNDAAALLSCRAEAFRQHLVPNALGPEAPTRGRERILDTSIAVHALTDRSVEHAPKRVLISCLHLLGDALAATPVVRAYRRLHPDHHITLLVPDAAYAQIFELCPDVDQLAFARVDRYQLVYEPSTALVESMQFAEGTYDERLVLDIQAVATAGVKNRHMSQGYADLAGIEIESRRPSIDVEKARRHVPALGLESPYVVLSRHSVSGVIGAEHKDTKRWEDQRWRRLVRLLRRELGLDVVSIGVPGEPVLMADGALDAHCLSILEVAGLLADAALLITVDNGIYHLGQGLRTPTVHLCPGWFDRQWTACDPDGPHIDLYCDLRRLSVARVFAAAKELLGANPS